MSRKILRAAINNDLPGYACREDPDATRKDNLSMLEKKYLKSDCAFIERNNGGRRLFASVSHQMPVLFFQGKCWTAIQSMMTNGSSFTWLFLIVPWYGLTVDYEFYDFIRRNIKSTKIFDTFLKSNSGDCRRK